MDSFLKIERKKEEENIQKWALCIFSDNEAAWRQCDDAEMILPDGNDNNNGSNKFITEAETTEAFLPSDYSSGVELTPIIRPLPTPHVHLFISVRKGPSIYYVIKNSRFYHPPN